MQRYTQSTYETCLACSLLQSVDRIIPVKITQKLELECINHSLKFSKDDFTLGHLDFIVKNFSVTIERIVDNKLFLKYLKKLKPPTNVITSEKKISLNLINKLIDEQPIILYIDAYALFGLYHYPHFITVISKHNNRYKIFDTWDGKEKTIDSKTLTKGISLLRNHMKFCPQILVIHKRIIE